MAKAFNHSIGYLLSIEIHLASLRQHLLYFKLW